MNEGEIIFRRLLMMAESEECENGPWHKIVNAIISYHEGETEPEKTDDTEEENHDREQHNEINV